MHLSEISTTVESLSGVGPATAKQFAKLNIFTVADLLQTFPRSYEDRTKRISLCEYAQHPKIHTIAKVLAHSWFGFGRMRTLKITISDDTTIAHLIAFNRPFLEKSLPEGSIIAVTGSFLLKYNEIQSTAFEAQRLSYDGELNEWKDSPMPDAGVMSIYGLTEGLSQKVFRKTVATALKMYGKAIDDDLNENIIRERSLMHKAAAIDQIHRPTDIESLRKARHTLIYEELFAFEYKMALRSLEHRGSLPTFDQTAVFENSNAKDKEHNIQNAAPFFSIPQDEQQAEEKIKINFEHSLSPRQKHLYERLPFSLTSGQMASIMEMNEDIDKSQMDFNNMVNSPADIEKKPLDRQPFSMQRLLQGDVGSGKTLVAFFMCLREVDYGGQCAILAPTELLARQHAENAAKMLECTGTTVAFLTGNLKSQGRDHLLKALAAGQINIVIGTHALFSTNVAYKNLQLAVIDEQHRFGVAQREAIVAKGRVSSGPYSHSPDVLMMSATPIPQTLALTAFGDLDITTIRSMPTGRKAVRTLLSVMGHESNVYEAVRAQLKAGHQAYFVYPRINEGDSAADGSDGIKSAEEMFNYLSTKVYPTFRCELIHSKIDENDQNRILQEFKDGSIQVLVATTVVEVGVDVGNATCIVIEHADRFGLAELHQLRGRVGRSSLQSYCFLIYGKNISESGIARMKALKESTDGFKIAEEDLRLRGPGEVTGTAQSGYLTLSIADLSRDKETLMTARADAFNTLRTERQKAD